MNKGYAANFEGIIRDIVFDSKLISFNKPVAFKGVGIGREGSTGNLYDAYAHWDHLAVTGPVTGLTSSIYRPSVGVSRPVAPPKFNIDEMMSIPAENVPSCAPATHMMGVKVNNAMRFGDPEAGLAFLRHPTSDGEFYSDFTVEFWFRTYYPNGVIFTLAKQASSIDGQENLRPVLTFAVVKGRMVMKMRLSHNHKIELVSFLSDLNDGKWHRVHAGRKDYTMFMVVDYKDRMQAVKPGRKITLIKGVPAFIGGLPESLIASSDEHSQQRRHARNFMPTVEPFRGCIRNLYINTKDIDMTKVAPRGRARPCFADIEKGAFFSGEKSFAIYEPEFNIGLKADIEFDFRTIQTQGVLLSMSNGSREVMRDASNGASLSIELLKDGSIVATADIGRGPFSAKKTFSTRYELCDGHWHSVRVQYTRASISLKIDQHEVVYGLNEVAGDADAESLEPFTEAPLYIGGLPKFAPAGWLAERQPFVGCIRNLEVNGHRKDWLTDMTLFEVLPNSCPTINQTSTTL